MGARSVNEKTEPIRARRRLPRSLKELTPSGTFAPRAFFREMVLKPLRMRRSGHPKPVSFPRLREGQVAITWIGHASFLVQFTDLNVLIDPIFTNWLFLLKRVRRPGVKMSDLPAADLVLLTHAHFDHFHKPTLRRLPAPRIAVAPWGVGTLARGLGFDRVIELEWWDAFERNGWRVVLTPSRHWGARMLRDERRGYGGFVLEHQDRRIYHAGDSAYFDGFKEIGERLRPEVALLPIGAYQPEGMRRVHMSPEDALKSFRDLGAKAFVPMHYGSFRLSFEDPRDPPRRLMELARAEGLEKKIRVIEEGVPTVF